MILLTGLESRIGFRVAKRLLKSGYGFTALVEDPDKLSDLKSKEVTFIKGDLSKSDNIKKAMDGIENAFLLSPVNDNQTKAEKNFIDIAKKQGVEHVVKYSAIGADPDSDLAILRNHGESEKYLKKSDLRYTIIRPSLYMQIFVDLLGQQIRKKREIKLPLRSAKCSYLDERDMTRAIKKVLTSNGHKNRTYTLTGPESLSTKEVAELFTDTMGKKIGYEDIRIKEFRQNLISVGFRDSFAEPYAELFRDIREGAFDLVSDDIYKLTERQTNTFEEFLDDNVKFFLGK